jgi:hypothetical protein
VSAEESFEVEFSLDVWLDPVTRQKVGIMNGKEIRSEPLSEFGWHAAIRDGWKVRHGGHGRDDSRPDGPADDAEG